MPIRVIFDGTSYDLPIQGEVGWSSLTDYLVALSSASTGNSVKSAILETASTSVTVTITDFAVICTSDNTTVTLPPGIEGQAFFIGNRSNTAVTVQGSGGELIESAATHSNDKLGYLYQFNGTQWRITGVAEDVPKRRVVEIDFDGTNAATIDTVDGKVYHLDTTGASGLCTLTIPDSSAANDGQYITLLLSEHTYDVDVVTTSGQLIGNLADAFIKREDTGLTIVSHFEETKYEIIQDSRQVFPSDGTADMIEDNTAYRNFTGTAACLEEIEITKDVAAGTIDIPASDFLLRDSTDLDTSSLALYRVPAKTGLAISNHQLNYIYANYNGGNPVYEATTDFAQLNTSTKILFANVFRDGTNYMDVYQAVCPVRDSIGSIATAEVLTRPVKRATGSILSNPTGLKIKVTAGTFFSVFSPASCPEIDTASTGTFTTVYKSGASTWTRNVGETDINNTQYNNGSTLTSLSSNRYTVRYVYWFFDDPSRLIVLFGGAQYTSRAAARAAAQVARADLPPELQGRINSFLVGSIIVQEGNSSIVQFYNTQDVTFSSAQATEHNDLGGLNDGDYKHLTATEYTNFTDVIEPHVIATDNPHDIQDNSLYIMK